MSAQDVIDALRSQAGKDALWAAIANRDVIQAYDSSGAALPVKPDEPASHTVSALTVLQRAGRMATVLSPERILAIVAALKAEQAEVPPTADEVADAVVTRLGAAATPAEKAALLRAALGADAAEVGRILAAAA